MDINAEKDMGERSCLLEWRAHLARSQPQRLPLLLTAIAGAACCVWLMFRSWLPAAASILLLVGATREFLFPLRYRLTTEGVSVEGWLIRQEIPWREVRRLLPDRDSVTLTPLPAPSRLDAFRGVCLRFAPQGQPGDRDSVMKIVRQCTPELLNAETLSQEAP